MILISAILFFVLIFLIFYYYLTKNFDFWKKRNVSGPKPTFFFGNYKDNLLGKIHTTELTKKWYDEYKDEKLIGIFVMNSPVLILRDPELIKHVLAKDFSVFSDRGIHVYERIEPLSQHFFNLPKSSWEPLRKKLSPVFTVTKIKQQFSSIVNVADRFVNYVEKFDSTEIECAGLVAKFMGEIIGEYGFDLKMNEINDGYSEFRMISKNRMSSNKKNFIRRFLREHFPNIYKYCYCFYNEKMVNYYNRMVMQIFQFRKNNEIHKNDYLGGLMDLKEQLDGIEITDNMLAAQAYVFFTAGADTTALTISHALYEIAANSKIQKKLRCEVNEVIKNEEKLSFDNVKQMEYLNLIFKETLRKYPLRNITRKCNQPYTFPGTDITIPKNTQIIVPHYAIQRDHRIYAEPDVFNPERFVDCQDLMTYLPFGNGPRKCIGELFASVVSKTVIANIVRNFELDVVSAKHNQNDPRKVFLFPKNGINLRFKKL